jgi:hypothetical protein
MFEPIKLSLTVLKEGALRRFERFLEGERARSLSILMHRAGDVDQPTIAAVNGNRQLEDKLFLSWKRRKAIFRDLQGQLFFGAATLVLLLGPAGAIPAVLLSDHHWLWKIVEAAALAIVLAVTAFFTWSFCAHELLDTLQKVRGLLPTSSGAPRRMRDEMSYAASSMLVLGPSAIHCRGGELSNLQETFLDHDVRYEDVRAIMISRDDGVLGIISDKPTFRLVLQNPAEAERIAEGILMKARSMGNHVPSMWITTRHVEDIPGPIPEDVIDRLAASLQGKARVHTGTGPLGKTLVVDMRDVLAIDLKNRVALFEGYRVRYTVSAQSTDAESVGRL